MEIFLELMIFIMGTFFGSFFTLAVYRIPLKKDITHERSFCPNCNHRLEFLDLIPVWSYIFLGGKCRYCGQKIRIRYLLFEMLSGIVFVTAYNSLHIHNIFLDMNKIVLFLQFVFLYVTIVIVSGIDKEYRKINTSVLLFGSIMQIIYILYLYIMEKSSIYRYGIYFGIFILIYIINKILQKKKENYFLEILLLISYILFTCLEKCTIVTILCTVIIILLAKMCRKKEFQKISIGFYLGTFAIILKIVENYIIFYL